MSRKVSIHTRQTWSVGAGRVELSTFVLFAVAVATTVAQVSDHPVTGPRAIMKAIEIVESRCSCPITYEDPATVPPDVNVQFTFTDDLPEGTDPHRGEALHHYLKELLEAASRSALPRYYVQHSAWLTHVIPADGGTVLDFPVPAVARGGTADEVIASLLKEIRRPPQTPPTVLSERSVATLRVPITVAALATLRLPSSVPTATESARTALSRILDAAGGGWSWRLLYDARINGYELEVYRPR